jgi:DNA primase
LHVLVPLEAKWDYDDVFEATKAAAKPFVDSRKDCTLQLVKTARKGRILIDIYRNRPSQTIVGPYSIRARAGAPVSTPLTWEEVEELKDPNIYHVGNVLERVKTIGDPWEAFVAYAVPLHTKRKAPAAPKPNPKARRRPAKAFDWVFLPFPQSKDFPSRTSWVRFFP